MWITADYCRSDARLCQNAVFEKISEFCGIDQGLIEVRISLRMRMLH